MLYLAIDQHRNQLTINLRDEAGDVILRKQVSTQWDKVKLFLDQIRDRAEPLGGFVTILEVCGFNSWLLKLLEEKGCRETVLIQPEERDKHKTDRRDAAKLGELLWVNRQRFLAGKTAHNVRRVRLPGSEDADIRQLTCLWNRLTSQRTRTINRIRHILNKHNLHHDMPTKGVQTKACRQWLTTLSLPMMDRLEMDFSIESWININEQLAKLEKQLEHHVEQHTLAKLLRTFPGMGPFNALVIASRLADGIDRFPRGKALANYWGITPGCCSSGNSKRRPGSILLPSAYQIWAMERG